MTSKNLSNCTNDNVVNKQGGEGHNVAPGDDYYPSGCGCIVLSDIDTLLHSLYTAVTLYDAGYDITLYIQNHDIDNNNNNNDNIIQSMLQLQPDTNVQFDINNVNTASTANNIHIQQYASLSYDRLYILTQYDNSGLTIETLNNNSSTATILNINIKQLILYLYNKLERSSTKIIYTNAMPSINDIQQLNTLILHNQDCIIVDCRLNALTNNTTHQQHNINMTQHISSQHNEPFIYVCNHPYDSTYQTMILTSPACAKHVLTTLQRAHRLISKL